MDKSKLHKVHQAVYDELKAMLPEVAFKRWYDLSLYLSQYDKSEWKARSEEYSPSNIIDPPATSEIANRRKELISQAREAVSGYSETNGARKAVEALADLLENS